MAKDIIDLTLLIPTKNEEGNIIELLKKLKELNIKEIIFVDDSDDNTPEIILKQTIINPNRVKLHHRELHNRVNGLSGAVLSARNLIKTKYFAVMDADHQHPPSLIKEMVALACSDPDLDIVSASRFLPNSKVIGLSPLRRSLSLSLISITQLLHKEKLLSMTDPLTGLFLAKTELLHNPYLKPNGFKILLEIILSHPTYLKKIELPFTFSARYQGLSKASLKELRSLLEIVTRSRI
ncbi:MAG: glycosyltransferase [Candidatus Paceibacterota bacterium]